MNSSLETAANVLAGVAEGVSTNFGFVDYTVLFLILSVSLAIGFFFGCCGNQSKSTEDYLLGGRNMKTIPIAISLIASQLSGISIVALPAEVYVYGLQIALCMPIMTFVVLIINKVFIPVFYHNHIANCYEYLEMRFSKSVKNLITGLYVLNVLLVLPVTLFIPSLALAQVTNISLHVINAACVCVCVIYTMLGGIKAVVWTDVVQATVMIGSTMLSVVLGVKGVGGFSNVVRIADEGGRLNLLDTSFDFTTRQTVWNMSSGYLIMWIAYVGLNQSCIQRIVSVPSLGHAKRALFGFLLGYWAITGLNIFLGIAMYAKYAGCDPLGTDAVSKPDKMVPFFVQDMVGHIPGLTGVFVSCVFSAGLSTMSANLNSLAGVMYEDYFRKFVKHTEEKANNIMKLTIVLVGVYCIIMGVVVEEFSSILQMVMTVSSVNNGTTFGVFCLGMLWPKANKKGALYGCLLSATVTIFLIVGSQIKLMNNEILYPILPSSTEECLVVPENVTSWISSHSVPIMTETMPFFNIAFPWFSVIGTVIAFVSGIVISYFTGGYDISRTGTKLISPVAHSLVPKEIREVELQTLKAKGPISAEEEAKAHWTWSSPDEIEETNEKK